MIKRWVWLLPAIIVTFSLAGCGSNPATETPVTESPATPTVTILNSQPVTPLISPQPGSTVGGPFLPGEVMAGLPVYPGAMDTTEVNPGFGPPSFPAEMPLYGAKIPGYQSASAQYAVQATQEDILGWYQAQLGAKGYRSSGEDVAGSPTLISHSIPFFLPSQPLISVEVHVYNSPNNLESSVFELLVIYTVPLPKPAEESLPGDINSLQIDYAPGTANEVVKTITDSQIITTLVSMVNNLPVRPDYITTGGPIGALQTLYRLLFHSAARGDITITDTIISGIQMDDYPNLDDPHNLFQEALKQVLGIL